MEQNTSHDIFTDPALVKAKQDDPFFKYVNSHWRETLVMVAVVLGGYYVVTSLQKSYYESRVASADVFQKAQDSLKEVLELEQKLAGLNLIKVDAKTDTKEAQDSRAKEKIEVEQKLKSAKEALGQRVAALGDQKAPYSDMAPLFNSVAAVRGSDLAAAKLAADNLNQNSSAGDGASLAAELASLANARLNLDIADKRADAFASLISIVKESRFVAVSAASTLARVASSGEEKAQAKIAIDALLVKSPQQADLLAEDLKFLGVKSGS
jgi:hypothetical protein